MAQGERLAPSSPMPGFNIWMTVFAKAHNTFCLSNVSHYKTVSHTRVQWLDIWSMLQCCVLFCAMLCVWPIQSTEAIINQSPLLSENQRLLSCVWYSCEGFRSRKSVPEDSVGSTVEKQRDFTVVVWTVGTTVENRHGKRGINRSIPPSIPLRRQFDQFSFLFISSHYSVKSSASEEEFPVNLQR